MIAGYSALLMGIAPLLASCTENAPVEVLSPSTPSNAALDPKTIPKYEHALVVPPVMPPTGVNGAVTEYRIRAAEFDQQVLPPPLPKTTVWGYGRDGDPLPGAGAASTYGYPAPTVETRSQSPVRVTWINGLTDPNGKYLPHLLPVDSTIHWADPGSGTGSHAGGNHGTLDGAPYTGPVPIVTHVHGAHSFDHSDGHPEAWFLPDATNIPAGFASQGARYRSQEPVGPGAAVFDYPLDESSATLWYHDHALGMTRLNVHAGLAGFWIIRGDDEESLDLPGPGPRLGDPPGTRYYEIPLVIQDRTFARDGSLAYPDSRTQYDGYKGPFIPDSAVPPIWGPEFLGNVIVVNGRVWPYLEVEPRLYRLRLLNASDARTLILGFDRAGIEFTQIGGDGGLLPDAPIRRDQVLIGPAERYDVLVDFSGLKPGSTLTMLNTGPDDPWGGPNADPPQDPADPNTTGQVMQFRVVARTSSGMPGSVPAALPAIEPLSPTAPARDLLLAELSVAGDYPIHVRLGTVALGPLPWSAPATEVVRLNDTEIWRVANTTDDAHPIHLHLVDFQVLDRQTFDVDRFKVVKDGELARAAASGPLLDSFVTGRAVAADPAEAGRKDTVLMLPGTITRIVARFDRAGSYVWHCHIIEHEDNDMMRPLEIVP